MKGENTGLEGQLQGDETIYSCLWDSTVWGGLKTLLVSAELVISDFYPALSETFFKCLDKAKLYFWSRECTAHKSRGASIPGQEMHSIFILKQIIPFPHWLEALLTVFHYWLVFKGLMQGEWRGKEPAATLIQACNRALCMQIFNWGRRWGGKAFTYKVGEKKRFEFLTLETSFILFDRKDLFNVSYKPLLLALNIVVLKLFKILAPSFCHISGWKNAVDMGSLFSNS